MMRGWGSGWWLVGVAFMIFCMVMMARMMGGMMGHGTSAHGRHNRSDEPERTLADRLARGDIDVEEYNRLLEALRGAGHSTRT
jgi:putative membrane protein